MAWASVTACAPQGAQNNHRIDQYHTHGTLGKEAQGISDRIRQMLMGSAKQVRRNRTQNVATIPCAGEQE